MDEISDDAFGDPDVLAEGANNIQIREWNNEVNEYASEMLQTMKEHHTESEDLWLDFTSTFRPHSIRALTPKNLLDWIAFLVSRGVYVQRKRGFPRAKALLQCLLQDNFVQVKGNSSIREFETPRDNVVNQNSYVEYTPDRQAQCEPFAQTPIITPLNTNEEDNMEDTNIVVTTKRSSGVGGLMKAYQGRKKFSGSFDEDLNSTFEIFHAMANMCHLTDEEKVEGFPVILTEDALDFYVRSECSSKKFIDVEETFRDNYITEEQRNRVLITWQGTRLSVEMRENTTLSALNVFRKMVTNLAKLQRQLSAIYRKDQFLRDQIVMSSDSPSIQQSMRERVPTSSADAINRIATFLSSEPGSAASFIVTHDVHYTTGQKYGGKAQRALKPAGNRTRSISRWLAQQKGCFVCKKNHRARDYHSRQEVSHAIEKLKKKYPSALITIEDLSMVVQDLIEDNEIDAEATDDEDDEESDIEVDDVHFTQNECSVFEAEEEFLANAAYIHGKTFVQDQEMSILAMYNELRMGEETKFKGIYLDTCANRSSVMSLNQYQAYCKEFHVPMQLSTHGAKTLRGIGGKSAALGSAWIPIPFTKLKLIVDVNFQIVNDNVPTLLCMKDMVQNGLDISIQKSEISYKHRKHPLILENYFLIHRWKPEDVSYSMYTEDELRKLHRSFGHPTVSAFKKVLKAARPDEMNSEVKEWISTITAACSSCAKYGSKPRRFKITVGTDDLRFNQTVAVDIMYITQKKPVLHIVDEATHFNAACFLTKVSSEKVWKAFMNCWTRTYLGPPDHLRIDQGSQFVSAEFLSNAESDGIKILEAPIESPMTMSHVERYHGPLRVSYLKIRDSLPRNETDADCLKMAIKAVNDTVGPEGLCPTLLVFGSLPRPARNLPSETQIQRADAIERAMKEVRKEQAKRRVAFGLRTNGIPVGKENSEELRKLPAGAEVLIYRNKSKIWEGPFPFINIEGETVTVQLPSGRKIFRSTAVKPVTKSKLQTQCVSPEKKNPLEKEFDNRKNSVKVMFAEDGEYDYNKCFTTKTEEEGNGDYVESREKELAGLMGRKIFQIVDKCSVPHGARIFGTRFLDSMKTVDGKTFPKSRLVAQNYRDKDATKISTKSPTITRLGFRMAISLCVMFPDMEPYLRDISQAYTQADSNLDRKVYLKPVPDMKIPKDKVLLAVKPLYGIPESGLHWFVSYSGHHKKNLGMQSTKFDPCVLYRRNNSELEGITVLQVDDSFGFGKKSFLNDEDTTGEKYLSKPREILKIGSSHDFNGLEIRRIQRNLFELNQEEKLKKLIIPTTQTEFISERASVQYIGVCTRPDLCAASQLLASAAANPKKEDFIKMKKLIERCRSTIKVHLKYVPLDVNDLRLLLFTDASFANADKLKSQIGFVLVLADGSNNANILHYGSSRCKRITRSVMAAEIHGLIYGFDNAYVTRSMLKEILNVDIPIHGYVDSKTLFNVIAKNSATLEKRLQIDVFSLREATEKKELNTLSWIPGPSNIADGMTKGLVQDSHPLFKLMTTNKVSIKPDGWVQAS